MMTLALLCTVVLGAWAENTPITYIERRWDLTAVVQTEKTITDYEIITGSYEWKGLETEGACYVVTGNATCQTLNVLASNTHLILTDGSSLTITGGVLLKSGNSLHIHGQSNDSGQLIVTNNRSGAAGIGGDDGANAGILFIHGGTITATGNDGAAGIGGGDGGWGGSVTIYGGTVTATGGEKGAGIGGGFAGKGCWLYIYGGVVTATGGEKGAGIGAGAYNYWSTDNSNSDGELHVYEGATVTAIGGKYGAGIGGGNKTDGIKTYIHGGTVTAKGGEDAAGIGSGDCDHHSSYGYGGEIHIEGGTVRAEGAGYGAGIGGGEESYGADVYITGGTVIAIAGEKCKGREANSGCAIGGGDGISKGVSARELEIGDNMMVTGGDAENNIERVFTSAERDPACRWRNFVKIEVCKHETPTVGSDQNEPFTYSIDDDLHHTKHCRFCNYTLQEGHANENCVCGVENATYQFTIYLPGTEKNTYVKGATTTVGAGKNFYLPECTNVPAGYIFKGWEMNPAPEDVNRWAAVKGGDSSSDINYPAGSSVTALLGQGQTASFYARFLYDPNWETIWDYFNPTTGTRVLVTHTDSDFRTGILTPGSNETGSLTITSETLKDDNNREFGTRYTASATYIVNGYEYTYANVKNVISLSDNADNSSAISAADSHTADITLIGRTLYKDGSWNTLCLPFKVTVGSGQMAGATAMTLNTSSSGFNASTGVLTLNFDEVEQGSTIEAGTPFIVKWSKADGYDANPAVYNVTNPVFVGVTVCSNTANSTATTDDGKVSFIGNFNPVTLPGDDKSNLYLGNENQLCWLSADKTLNALRAYLHVDGTVLAVQSNLAFELMGDVNDSGLIDIGDAVCIVNHLVNKTNTVFKDQLADLNGNDDIDIGDAVMIVNILVGKTGGSAAPLMTTEEELQTTGNHEPQ